MFNIPPIKTTEPIKAELMPGEIKAWKVGQVLYGRAETGGPALSNVILRIGEQRLQAQTPIELKAGESLKLLIKELGDPPLLSIQGKLDKSRLAADQLKNFIVQQTDIEKTLSQLKNLQNQPQIPRNIQQSIQTLLQQLPDLKQATQAQGLKSLLNNNGIFLESGLLKNNPGIQNNLKARLLDIQQQLVDKIPLLKAAINLPANNSLDTMQNLLNQFQQGQINIRQLIDYFVSSLPASQAANALQALNQASSPLPDELNRLFTQLVKLLQQQPDAQAQIKHLAQQLKNIPPLLELKSAVDNLLNKITTQQLIPLSRDMDNSLLLIFNLLFKDAKEFYPIDLKIEEQPAPGKNNKKDWLVSIKFEFSSLGLIQAQVHLLDNQVSTFFQAEKKHTASLIQQHLPELDRAFQQAGFQIMQLNIEQHKINQQPEYPDSVHILDEDV